MSLGPLTTTFTPPADCTASSALYWVNTESTFYWMHGRPGQSSCFPDSYSPYQNQYYSPGICPVGYTRACESVMTGSGPSATTHATCCPQGNYICASTSDSYSYPWGPTLGCMSVYRVNTETSFTTIDGTIGGDETAGSATSLLAPGTIMAYGVVVQNTPSADGTTTASDSSSQTSSSIASETASTSDSSSGSHGLSSGAAAGIGIGAAVGAMAIGAVILWMFLSRRRKRREQEKVELQQAAEEEQRRAMGLSPGSWSETTYGAAPFPQQQQAVPMNWPPPMELASNVEPKEVSSENQMAVEKDGRSLNWR
ncbi:hypothetical protein F4804DRAFT_30122 [Jackrogersella minutella]|nr:hypothetical protein F4804DRAFT_30122 [Jackrogersella minutella]